MTGCIPSASDLDHDVPQDHVPEFDPLLQRDPNADPPFDIAEVPLHLRADDAHHQNDIDEAIMRTTHPDDDPNYDTQFRATRFQRVPLSLLKRYFDDKSSHRAMHLLQTRGSVSFNQHFLLSVDDDDIIPFFEAHYIDFALSLGSRIGLDAVLPNPLVLQDHTWHIQLTFSRLFKH